MEITKVKGRTHCFDRFMLIKRPPFIGNVDLIRDICRDLFKNNIACKEIFVLFVWISNFVERVDAGSPQTLNQRKIGFRLNQRKIGFHLNQRKIALEPEPPHQRTTQTMEIDDIAMDIQQWTSSQKIAHLDWTTNILFMIIIITFQKQKLTELKRLSSVHRSSIVTVPS